MNESMSFLVPYSGVFLSVLKFILFVLLLLNEYFSAQILIIHMRRGFKLAGKLFVCYGNPPVFVDVVATLEHSLGTLAWASACLMQLAAAVRQACVCGGCGACARASRDEN